MTKSKRWTASVIVMPKEGVNDPEGEAIRGGLNDLGYSETSRVRAGKRYEVTLAAADADRARKQVISMADRLLANPVIQTYEIESIIPDSEAETGS
jgi:phosphoribosylformylglycinamidine synthase subunit PurS